MKQSKNNILFTLTLFGLSLLCTGLIAQDKEKSDKERSRWERKRFERPVPPVQPIQPVQPVRPVQPVQPVGPVAPIPPIPPSIDAHFTSMHRDNGPHNFMEYSNDEAGINIKASGRIRLTSDKKEIRSIRNDGFLQIKEQNRESGREIYIETDRNGDLVYDFYRKGKKLDFDKEGKNWLNTVWKDVVNLLDK